MRPGQNKRMRGRNSNNNSSNNRRGPNPLTRSYESNGPDVKIRGTAHHVGEKYLQLARDAQSSGDPVMAESYLQHAEHYFRLIASAQLAQQQAQIGYQRQPGEQVEQDDEGDDDFDSLPDRFASPSERAPPPPPVAPPPQPAYEPRSYNERQPYEARNGHAPNGQYGDRQNQDRQQQDRPDRQNDNRPRYADRQDRSPQQDRSSQQGDRTQQDRGNGGERHLQGNGGERPNRDYDNRNFRKRDDRPRDGQQPRDLRDQQRETRQPVPDEQPSVGLPAFITAPTRVQVPDAAEAEQPAIAAVVTPETAPETGDEASFHMRPRRRRRPKSEFAVAEAADGRAEAAPGGGDAEA